MANTELQIRRRQKFVSSVEGALKAAVLSGDQELILDVLRIYDQLHFAARRPNIELIKTAISHVPAQASSISPEAVVTLYAQYAVSASDTNLAVEVLREHSADYLSMGASDAYVACIHAEATAVLERFNRPCQARELIQGVMARPNEVEFSEHCVARGELLVADAYWVENNYSESRDHYRSASDIEYEVQHLAQHIAERLCDCSMNLGQYKRGVRLAVGALRSRHSTLPSEWKARFYARMAYGYALSGELRKAAVSCLGLCRTAESENSDALYCLAAMVAAWLVSRLDYSDPAIPKNEVQIRDSSALSADISPEQVQAHREADPFKTKGIILVATVFEFLGEVRDLRRSEYLFREAVQLADAHSKADPTYLDVLWVFHFRIARLEVKRGRFTEAAKSFKAAFASLVPRIGRDKPDVASDGPAVVMLLDWVEPGIKGCPDPEVGVFFDSLYHEFRGNLAVCAWLRYRESKILFARYVVQAAKRKLLEAERLAQNAGGKLLITEIIYDKLFNRVEQFYSSNGNAWLVDALNAAAFLAADEFYGDTQSSFANNVRVLANHQRGAPFDELNTTVSRLTDSYKDQMFFVVTYAMWRAAAKHRLLAASLNTLETYLRQNATFLTDDDFH